MYCSIFIKIRLVFQSEETKKHFKKGKTVFQYFLDISRAYPKGKVKRREKIEVVRLKYVFLKVEQFWKRKRKLVFTNILKVTVFFQSASREV
jgi:hypothetical protein